MYIDFTPEELLKMEQIRAKYAPERDKIVRELAQLVGKVGVSYKRRDLQKRLQKNIDRFESETAVFVDMAQRKRFRAIKDDSAAIIDHAKEQAPIILKNLHELTQRQFETLSDEDLDTLQLGEIKDGTLYVNANYAARVLTDELRLHIGALQEDKTALQELYGIIIEAAESSPYTDGAEITDAEENPLDIMRVRRTPLQDITMYGLMNDKTSAQLLQDSSVFQQDANGQLTLSWAVDQAPKGDAVPVYMALTYEGTEGKITKKLTGYDSAVYNAVATRFYYWQLTNKQKPLYITPQEIWRTMNGKKSGDGQAKPSKTQVKRICASLDKMRFTRFQMDITNEIREFNLHIDDERITDGRIETYLLNSSKVEFITDKGNTVQGYRLAEEPILYSYNRAKKHILEVPYEMLDTSAKTSDSENVTEFRNYLLQQIQLMKNAAEEKGGKYFKRSNVILLESIYKNTGILPPEERIAGKEYKTDASRQKEIRRYRQADRQKIEGILDAWKAKGWIKGYTVLNRNNAPIKERQQARGYGIRI